MLRKQAVLMPTIALLHKASNANLQHSHHSCFGCAACTQTSSLINHEAFNFQYSVHPKEKY